MVNREDCAEILVNVFKLIGIDAATDRVPGFVHIPINYPAISVHDGKTICIRIPRDDE